MPGGLTVLERLYPEERINCRGVNILVTPLPFVKVPKVIDQLWSIVPRLSSGSIGSQDLADIIDDVVVLLDECVTIPEDPEVKVKQLPLDVFPQLLTIFLEQSFNLGKWEALMERASQSMERTTPRNEEKT